MSTAARAHLSMSFEDFLEFEARSPERHEFVGGQLVAMSGGSRAHDVIATNIVVAIRNALRRGGPCRVHQSGLAVRVDSIGAWFYPDLHITCDPRDHADPRASRYPSMIIEVLSPSTANYDAGQKFNAYKRIETLREYVLVDSECQSVTLHRRDGPRRWTSLEHEAGDGVELAVIGHTIPLADIYDGTDLPLQYPWPRLIE